MLRLSLHDQFEAFFGASRSWRSVSRPGSFPGGACRPGNRPSGSSCGRYDPEWGSRNAPGGVLVPGDVLHVGVAHQQVHRRFLDPLVQQEHVARRALTFTGCGTSLVISLSASFELLAGVPVTMWIGHMSMDTRNSVSDYQLIGIAGQGHFFAVEVLVHVGDDVQELAPLDVMVSGTVIPAVFLRVSTNRSVAFNRWAGREFRRAPCTWCPALWPQVRRPGGLKPPCPRCCRPRSARNRHAPGRKHVVLAGLGAIHDVTGVGEHDGGIPRAPRPGA